MNVHRIPTWCAVTALVALSTSLGLGRAMAQTEAGMEVLTRGPVHEAFAETIAFDPQPGITVSTAPPEMIEEVPPDQRPEGVNVTWIPGYWGWDDERNDYLWVSGIWRALPPGREWVPGYWGQTGQGFQWVSGYWDDSTSRNVEYLPEPPPSEEVGPNIASPSPDDYWVPGCWVWVHNRYAWRPGYWMAGRQDWDWVPAHYVWAPRGYVFSDGYWDYPVDYRGVLFAPVYFDSGVYRRPGFHYSPSIVISLSVFSDNLFVRPGYSHYYFGDYYAPGYQSSGFFAAFSFTSSHHGYDPIYQHQRWEHRQDAGWDHRVEADFQNRRDHEEARPARTFALQTSRMAGGAQMKDKSQVVAVPYHEVATQKGSPVRYQPVPKQEKAQIAQRSHEVQNYRATRQKLEAPPAHQPAHQPAQQPGQRVGRPSAPATPAPAAPARVARPRSPIVAKSPAQLGRGHAPPSRPQAPKPESRGKPGQAAAPPSRDHGPAVKDNGPASGDHGPAAKDNGPASKDHGPPAKDKAPPPKDDGKAPPPKDDGKNKPGRGNG